MPKYTYGHAHGRPLKRALCTHIWSQMPMALPPDTALGALCTARSTPQIYMLRHAGVGVLSLRRAPNLGKLARAARIPAPGPISSSLTLTQSPCGICRFTPPRENTTTTIFAGHRATPNSLHRTVISQRDKSVKCSEASSFCFMYLASKVARCNISSNTKQTNTCYCISMIDRS